MSDNERHDPHSVPPHPVCGCGKVGPNCNCRREPRRISPIPEFVPVLPKSQAPDAHADRAPAVPGHALRLPRIPGGLNHPISVPQIARRHSAPSGDRFPRCKCGDIKSHECQYGRWKPPVLGFDPATAVIEVPSDKAPVRAPAKPRRAPIFPSSSGDLYHPKPPDYTIRCRSAPPAPPEVRFPRCQCGTISAHVCRYGRWKPPVLGFDPATAVRMAPVQFPAVAPSTSRHFNPDHAKPMVADTFVSEPLQTAETVPSQPQRTFPPEPSSLQRHTPGAADNKPNDAPHISRRGTPTTTQHQSDQSANERSVAFELLQNLDSPYPNTDNFEGRHLDETAEKEDGANAPNLVDGSNTASGEDKSNAQDLVPTPAEECATGHTDT